MHIVFEKVLNASLYNKEISMPEKSKMGERQGHNKINLPEYIYEDLLKSDYFQFNSFKKRVNQLNSIFFSVNYS